MTDHTPRPLDLDAAFRRCFIASAHDVAAIKNEPTWPEAIWAQGVCRGEASDGPWWAGVYPADPDRFPPLDADETNRRADREARR